YRGSAAAPRQTAIRHRDSGSGLNRRPPPGRSTGACARRRFAGARARGRTLAALRPAVLEARDPAPGAVRTPDSRAQAFQLHDLAVVDEQVDVDAVMLEVPFKHRGIGGFEHDIVEADAFGDLRDHVDAPAVDVLGQAFRLDHDDLGPG